MTPQQLIRTILDAVAEDDLRKAEDVIGAYVNDRNWEIVGTLTDFNVALQTILQNIHNLSAPTKENELFTQQNKP